MRFGNDSQFRTSNIQICICGSVNLHRYCAMHRACGNSANYSTSPSEILLSPEIACAPIHCSSGIKGRVTSLFIVFDLRFFVARFRRKSNKTDVCDVWEWRKMKNLAPFRLKRNAERIPITDPVFFACSMNKKEHWTRLAYT